MTCMYCSGLTFLLVVCCARLSSTARRSKPCQSCNHWAGREKRILAVRGQILTKLGLTEASMEDGGSINATQEVLDTFNTVVQEREMEFNAKEAADFEAERVDEVEYFAKEIVRLPLLKEHAVAMKPASGLRGNSLVDIYLLKFNLSALLSEGNFVSQAKLRLHVTPNRPPAQINGDVRVDVCGSVDSDSTANRSLEEICTEVLDSKRTSAREEGWISLDITSLARKWCSESNAESLIKVTVRRDDDKDATNSAAILGGGQRLDSRDYLAHALAWVVPRERTEAAKRRRRRSLSRKFCKTRPKELRCCLRSLYIDFRKDLHWKWIHAPSGFHANYCAGTCPFMWGSGKQNHHSTVMALYNSINPDAPGDSCCVAKAYKPLVILYYKDGQPKIEELKNMVVSRCTCL